MLKKLITTVSLLLCFCANAHEQRSLALERLKAAYPDHIHMVLEAYVLWVDGTYMPIGNSSASKSDALNDPTLADQLEQPVYRVGKPIDNPCNDPGRIRYEPFFRKMYGDSALEVQQNLVKVAWMPRIFGDKARILRVTTINHLHEKIKKISDELELLMLEHPEYCIFLNKPGGTYCWRNIAHTNRLSCHSFGMTLDITVSQSNYWQWDLAKEHRLISEDEPLLYRNKIPWEIVQIFEKYGFIWGGKWYHYDTMHFEYRPELMVFDKSS